MGMSLAAVIRYYFEPVFEGHHAGIYKSNTNTYALKFWGSQLILRLSTNDGDKVAAEKFYLALKFMIRSKPGLSEKIKLVLEELKTHYHLSFSTYVPVKIEIRNGEVYSIEDVSIGQGCFKSFGEYFVGKGHTRKSDTYTIEYMLDTSERIT